MEKKQKIIVIIVASAIFVVFLILFILGLLKDKPSVKTPVVNNQENKTEVIAKPIVAIQNERNTILNTARGFIEIYGTYTNTNDFANIKELYPFMTVNMVSKYEKIIASTKPSSTYFSKTTKALNVNLVSYKDGDKSATIGVSVVEKNIDYLSNETVTEKVYTVSMVKDSDKWKVNEVK